MPLSTTQPSGHFYLAPLAGLKPTSLDSYSNILDSYTTGVYGCRGGILTHGFTVLQTVALGHSATRQYSSFSFIRLNIKNKPNDSDWESLGLFSY